MLEFESVEVGRITLGGMSSILEILSPSSQSTRVAPVLKNIVHEYASDEGTLQEFRGQ